MLPTSEEGAIIIHCGDADNTQGIFYYYTGLRNLQCLSRQLRKEQDHGNRWATAYVHHHDDVYAALRQTKYGLEPYDWREILPSSIAK